MVHLMEAVISEYVANEQPTIILTLQHKIGISYNALITTIPTHALHRIVFIGQHVL